MFYQRSRHTTAMPGLASPTISVRSLAQVSYHHHDHHGCHHHNHLRLHHRRHHDHHHQECSGERTRRRRKEQPVSVYSLAKLPTKGGTSTEVIIFIFSLMVTIMNITFPWPFVIVKSQLGPLTIIPPGKRVSPLSPNFISETSLAVSPRFNWRQLEQQVIFSSFLSIEDISQARCLFLNSNSSSSSSNAQKVCLCYFQLRLSVQVHATCLRRTLV